MRQAEVEPGSANRKVPFASPAKARDCGSVVHLGDNRTGEGDGDDEQLRVTLSSLPPEIARIVFIASIDQAQERGQNFGVVSDAYIRFFDADAPNDDSRGARYDLAEDSATETALIFGELCLYNGGWKFRAVGQGNTSGLVGVLADFGLAGAWLVGPTNMPLNR